MPAGTCVTELHKRSSKQACAQVVPHSVIASLPSANFWPSPGGPHAWTSKHVCAQVAPQTVSDVMPSAYFSPGGGVPHVRSTKHCAQELPQGVSDVIWSANVLAATGSPHFLVSKHVAAHVLPHSVFAPTPVLNTWFPRPRVMPDDCTFPAPSYVVVVVSAASVRQEPVHAEHCPVYVLAYRSYSGGRCGSGG